MCGTRIKDRNEDTYLPCFPSCLILTFATREVISYVRISTSGVGTEIRTSSGRNLVHRQVINEDSYHIQSLRAANGRD